MSKTIHQPIRMCISCRRREPQKKLIRLQTKEAVLTSYSGVGRSFYLCKKCLAEDKHLDKKIAGRLKLNLERVEEFIKELRSNVEN